MLDRALPGPEDHAPPQHMKALAPEALRFIRCALDDWARETSEVSRLDVERFLQCAGFQVAVDEFPLRQWRNRTTGRQYFIMQQSEYVVPSVVSRIRDEVGPELRARGILP